MRKTKHMKIGIPRPSAIPREAPFERCWGDAGVVEAVDSATNPSTDSVVIEAVPETVFVAPLIIAEVVETRSPLSEACAAISVAGLKSLSFPIVVY